MCQKSRSCENIRFYCLKHTSDASLTQQFPLKTCFGTLRETLSKKDSQMSATKRLSARLYKATVSKCVPKGSQLSFQVVLFFTLFPLFRHDGLLGPQTHPRAPRRTQNVAPGSPKSSPREQKRSLLEPKSSQAATRPDTQTQRAQRTLHLPIAPRSQKTSRCGGVA